MLSYINKHHRNLNAEKQVQLKRIESAYQYRFKSEMAELSKINKRRFELFLNKAKADKEVNEYAELNKRKCEIDDLLKKGKDQIIREIGYKF